MFIEKKRPAFQQSAFQCHAEPALLNNYEVRITLADHALRVSKTVYINRDPAAVNEHEVAAPDQSEMARPVSLDEELFRMPPKAEHFTMTGSGTLPCLPSWSGLCSRLSGWSNVYRSESHLHERDL